MKVKWMVILNNGTKIGSNDYLVKQLAANGIMPIMRIYTPNGQPIEGDLGALVRHYRQLAQLPQFTCETSFLASFLGLGWRDKADYY
jgi:hypothetical protein